jgi:hypothetical protein
MAMKKERAVAQDQSVENQPAPEQAQTPAADADKAKKVPKMEQVLDEKGEALTFKFRQDDPATPTPPIEVKVSDFPENVRNFFAYFGMRTKLRNFTTPDAGQAEASPAQMHANLVKGIALLKAGHLRIAAEPGSKSGGTLLLEAAIHYRRRKHEMNPANVGVPFEETTEQVSAILEKLTDEQVEQLKGTKLFQLAMQDAKDARAAAKRKALEEEVAKEAANAPA